jgi:hypothetical protein
MLWTTASVKSASASKQGKNVAHDMVALCNDTLFQKQDAAEL